MKSTLNPKAASFVPAKLREPPVVVVLVGPPGSGKSTQGRALSSHYGFEHLSVADRLRDMNVKYAPSVASDVLDEGIQQVKHLGKPGVVVEFVRTIDGPLIVEETCRRYGLQVNCVLFLEMDDMSELTARVSSRAQTSFGRREDVSPQYVLSRIHEFMFIEEGILQHYSHCTNFYRIDASKPVPQVTVEVLNIVDKFRTAQTEPLESTTTEEWSSERLEPITFVPPECRFVSFVRSKTETMRILRRFQSMVGLQLGSTRRFPCSTPNTFDENGLQTILASEHKFTVSKKVDGPRYFLLWLKAESGSASSGGGAVGVGGISGDGSASAQCYLIDENLAIFRTQLTPLVAEGKQPEWGDMLLDGNLVMPKGHGVFITSDALYFDGCPVLAEYLDDRLEHLYDRFPPEGTVEQFLVGPAQCLCVLHKNYFTVRDIPRLLREFDIPSSQQPYPFDGLIFTPKRQGYKTGPDKNLFEWKPAERLTFEFRVVEDLHQSGSFQLLVGRMHGREFREVIYDCVEPQYQIPPFTNLSALAGSIVECAPRYVLNHRIWQVLCVRPDRTSPQRETFVNGVLQSCLTSLQLQQLFMHHAGVSADAVQAPPVPYGSPDPPRRIGGGGGSGNAQPSSSSSSLSLSALSSPSPSSRVADSPPRSPSPTPASWLMNKAVPAAAAAAPVPVVKLPPEPQPVSLQQLESILQSGKRGVFVESREGPRPATASLPAPLIEAALQPTPLAGSVRPATAAGVRGSTGGLQRPSSQQRRNSPVNSRPSKSDRQTTPVRRGGGGGAAGAGAGAAVVATADSDEDLNPTARRLTYAVDATPGGHAGAPFGTVTPLRPSAVHPSAGQNHHHSHHHSHPQHPQQKQNQQRRAGPQQQQHTPPSPHFNFNSPVGASPAPSAFATPNKWWSGGGGGGTGSGRRGERHDFLPCVKEWLIRKFRVQPSAAKPRPFAVLDAGCGGGADVRRWDAAKARYVAGCDVSAALVDEARATLVAMSSELQGDFFVADFTADTFTPAPKSQQQQQQQQQQQFHMVAMFGGLQYAFASESRARQTLQNVAKALLPGGIFLGTTTDADVILGRTADGKAGVSTPEYELSLLRPAAAAAEATKAEQEQGEEGAIPVISEQNAFGHQYSLTVNGETDSHAHYLVLPSVLQRLCEELKLEYIDYGHLNFHEVGAYLEKSATKGSVWRAMSPAERDVAQLYVTFAFRKEAN